jgi:hypothetical protein
MMKESKGVSSPKTKSFYKCGHGKEALLIREFDFLSIANYFYWKDNYGFDGDKSLCWRCFCGKINKQQEF